MLTEIYISAIKTPRSISSLTFFIGLVMGASLVGRLGSVELAFKSSERLDMRRLLRGCGIFMPVAELESGYLLVSYRAFHVIRLLTCSVVCA